MQHQKPITTATRTLQNTPVRLAYIHEIIIAENKQHFAIRKMHRLNYYIHIFHDKIAFFFTKVLAIDVILLATAKFSYVFTGKMTKHQ